MSDIHSRSSPERSFEPPVSRTKSGQEIYLGHRPCARGNVGAARTPRGSLGGRAHIGIGESAPCRTDRLDRAALQRRYRSPYGPELCPVNPVAGSTRKDRGWVRRSCPSARRDDNTTPCGIAERQAAWAARAGGLGRRDHSAPAGAGAGWVRAPLVGTSVWRCHRVLRFRQAPSRLRKPERGFAKPPIVFDKRGCVSPNQRLVSPAERLLGSTESCRASTECHRDADERMAGSEKRVRGAGRCVRSSAESVVAATQAAGAPQNRSAHARRESSGQCSTRCRRRSCRLRERSTIFRRGGPGSSGGSIGLLR